MEAFEVCLSLESWIRRGKTHEICAMSSSSGSLSSSEASMFSRTTGIEPLSTGVHRVLRPTTHGECS